jgi:hypothetical protein
MIDAVQLWKKLTGEDANGNDLFVCLSSVIYYFWFYYLILNVKQTYMQQMVEIRTQLMVKGNWTQKGQCKEVENQNPLKIPPQIHLVTMRRAVA